MHIFQYYIDQQEAHTKLDEIYNSLFSHIDKSLLTFSELSEEVFRKRNELSSLVLRGALNYELNKLGRSINANCIRCNLKLTRHRRKSSVLQSVNGTVLFSRDYFYCRKCKIGFCPSDKDLEIIPRKLQFDIQWRILEMIVKHPFEEACNEIEKHYNVKVQKKTAHELIQTVAKGLTFENTIRSASEVKEMLIRLRAGSHRRIVVVIGIDGAHVPIRPEHKSSKGKRGKGYWREAKGIRVYAIAEKRIHNIFSWHQIQTADQLKDSLCKILESNYIPSDVARICVCADGAGWIWNRVKKVFPGAKLVLDYYHCAEHLYQFANIFFNDESEKLRWVKSAKNQLFSGNVQGLVSQLRKTESTDEEIVQEIESLANYLEERADMTFYNSFKKAGYPIGSGGIESSNKYLCHRRMKISGAWWKEEMANDMLALRSAHVNGTLSSIFSLYKNLQRKRYFAYN